MQGLYHKYEIKKANGKPVDPSAQYFVLRIDTDRHARVAMATYADEIEKAGELQFANQIRGWLKEVESCSFCGEHCRGDDDCVRRAKSGSSPDKN